MPETTKIEWTAAPLPEGADLDWLRSLGLEPRENPLQPGQWLLPGFTFNPWIGCTKWASGCANCYAKTLMDDRYGRAHWGRGNPRQRTGAQNWNKVKRWNKISQQVFDRYGVRQRVFCGSLMDWADSEVDQSWRDDLFTLIGASTGLDWLMLTKRLEVKTWESYDSGMNRMLDILPGNWLESKWPDHVWFGHSVACQDDADKILDDLSGLAAIAAANGQHIKIFLSYEPATGPVDWTGFEFVDQIIVGGESGAGARLFDWDWATGTLEFCQTNKVKFFLKQLGIHPLLPCRMPGDPGWDEFGPIVRTTGKGGDPLEWPAPLPREYAV
jgi:protein gp37